MFALLHACQNHSVVSGSFRFMQAETKKSSATSGLPEEIYLSSFFANSISLLRLMKVWHILEGYLAMFEPPEIENRDHKNNFKAMGLNHQRYSSDFLRNVNMTEDYKIKKPYQKKIVNLYLVVRDRIL